MTPRTARAVFAIVVAALAVDCRGRKEEEAAPVVTVDVAPVLLAGIQRTIRADGVLFPRQQAAIVPMRAIRWIAASLFFAFGAAAIAGTLRIL